MLGKRDRYKPKDREGGDNDRIVKEVNGGPLFNLIKYNYRWYANGLYDYNKISADPDEYTYLRSDSYLSRESIKVVTSAYTVNPNDRTIVGDTDTADDNIAITMGPVGDSYNSIKKVGNIYTIVNSGVAGYNIPLTFNGSETLMGSTSETVYNGEAFHIQAGPTEWVLL